MGYSTILSLAGVAVLGTALGLQLGESSVDQIDPSHFRGPALHPRERGAAIEPLDFAPAGPAFAAHYGWAEGRRARAEDCGASCDLARRDRHADRQPAFAPVWEAPEADANVVEERGVRVHRASASLDMPELAPTPASEPVLTEREKTSAAVARYAYYPVSDAEARAVPRLPDPVLTGSE